VHVCACVFAACMHLFACISVCDILLYSFNWKTNFYIKILKFYYSFHSLMCFCSLHITEQFTVHHG
jgi:hypothetical protein